MKKECVREAIQKTYKDFKKMGIGSSDIGSLILAGCGEGGFCLKDLHFGKDAYYSAYIVTEDDVSIGGHYKPVAEFKEWMRIYDDEKLVCMFEADKIIVYRSGEMGCIIQFYNKR